MQTGPQSVLVDPMGAITMAVDATGTLYLGGFTTGIWTLTPGAVELTPRNGATVTSLAAAPDGTVYLGDNARNKLLKLVPGAEAPTEVPVQASRGWGTWRSTPTATCSSPRWAGS